MEFFQDVVIGANYGWNQKRATRATYDDLLGAGSFGLINDHGIRILISNYYSGFEGSSNRIEERETGYPNLTYELIPRSTSTGNDGVVWERGVEPNLSPDRVEKIYQNILDSDLEELIIAEANFGKFVTAISVSQLGEAKALRTTLANYLGSLD